MLQRVLRDIRAVFGIIQSQYRTSPSSSRDLSADLASLLGKFKEILHAESVNISLLEKKHKHTREMTYVSSENSSVSSKSKVKSPVWTTNNTENPQSQTASNDVYTLLLDKLDELVDKLPANVSKSSSGTKSQKSQQKRHETTQDEFPGVSESLLKPPRAMNQGRESESHMRQRFEQNHLRQPSTANMFGAKMSGAPAFMQHGGHFANYQSNRNFVSDSPFWNKRQF